MDKNVIIESINKSVRSFEMLMVRIKNGLNNDKAQNLDNILEPYTHFLEFLQDSKNSNLRELMGNVAFDSIVDYTQDALQECKKIYNILFVESKGLFSTKIKFVEPTAIDLEKAKSYYNNLSVINSKIEEYIKASMQRLNSLDKSKF